ncbi:nuclear transport factor 2 family protein [Marivita hallyeonensis]|uniref:Ketosteroid isomerase homolog n=1 Tax=Marivita hallyeonensis TaxID=996342 RepID=A0A1M5R4F4_9RHOB|nr:nuclear transport factor 2 family protein [Marivita hallyeonensis]SHH20996.1 Ketosteroid isomerase homolog [Marivita hallyeonensis]
MFEEKKKVAMRGAASALALGVLVAGSAQADDGGAAGVSMVSSAFYAALNDMLAGTPVSNEIAPLWLDADGVTAQHPIGGRDIGLNTLAGAFDGVASLAEGGEIALQDQAIAIFGDTAVETGVETGQATLAGKEIALEYRVTNVYTRTEDGWRMVHHHTDLSAPIIDLLASLHQ